MVLKYMISIFLKKILRYQSVICSLMTQAFKQENLEHADSVQIIERLI